MATKTTKAKTTKSTKDLFKDAFINNDKDFQKKVYIDIDGDQVYLATIKHLTQIEMATIAMACKKDGSIVSEKEFINNIDAMKFSIMKTKESLVDWAFDEEINFENIKYLSDKFSEPIFKAINELEELWLAKSE